MHGDQDSVVYIRSTYKFLEEVEQRLPETEIRFDVVKGQEHAFDHMNFHSWESFLSKPGALDFVQKAWLRSE